MTLIIPSEEKVPVYDITIKAGADYTIDFTYAEDDETPIDLTGWTAEAQLRETDTAPDAVDFSCSVDSAGVHLELDHDETAALRYAVGCYDVFITDPGGTSRTPLIRGQALIVPGVTR